MASLVDYMKQLSTPAPEYQDPEDDAGDETVACLASRDAESEKTESSALQSTSLRRRAAAYLASDERYRGKKTSRKDLYEFAGDSSNDDDMDSVDQESVGDETSNKLVNGYSDSEEDEDEEVEEKEVTDEEEDEEETDAEGEKDAVHDEDDDDKASPLTTDNSDIDEEEEGEEEDREMLDDSANYEDDLDDSQELADDYDDASDEEITSSEEGSGGEDIIQDAEKDEREKAQAVVLQLAKCETIVASAASHKELWDQLMELRIQQQKVLSMVNTLPTILTTSTAQQQAQTIVTDMARELYHLQNEETSSRKRKAETDLDLEELSAENFTSLQASRNKSISFWDEKTRLAAKKFKSFNSFNTPVLKQVEQILSDRDRLIRRTQVNRDSETPDAQPEEIFDDNDFYQRLLKNLIESKSAEDSSMLSSSTSQWLELQKLRGKKKKKKKDVDTRASKGRKLRYNVHSKLVNFMAPRDDSTWSENAKNELFKNLFKMPTATEQ